MDCLFCSIIAKNIPSKIVYEDDQTLAFLDIQPLAAGHTVIVPKHHADRIAALPEEFAGPLGLTVRRVSDILHKSLAPEGFTIGINDGVGAHQGVGHLHIHVIPRWLADQGGNLHSIIKNPPTMSLDEVAKKLAASSSI